MEGTLDQGAADRDPPPQLSASEESRSIFIGRDELR